MDQSGEMSASEMSAIRSQMDETRTALAEKIGMLEKQVTTTMSDTVQSVGDTVESVKHAVEDTVQQVKSTVQESVQQVKTSLQDGAHAVGEALSIRHHVEQHPWPMMAGAVAVGFVGGYMLFARSDDQRAEQKFRRLASTQGRPPEQQYGTYDSRESVPQPMPASPRRASNGSMGDMRQSTSSNAFNEWLRPATQQIQSMAIGATLSILRDMISQAVPKPLEPKVHELVDGLTASLGGQVIRENLVNQFASVKRG
jgi:ElaB/YqjD/DUF883 family membrane-anchored ribosome-binding protein